MNLIPVLDLMQGVVVHARKGERSAYAPIRSTLCKGADPEEVLDALLGLFDFRTIYVADLDAIRRRGSHIALLAAWRTRFPDVEFWVDAGIADETVLRHWTIADIGRPVLGSESLADADFPGRAVALCGPLEPVLSLDFFGAAFRGPPALLADSLSWPGRVLAMNLHKVGSEAGPDLALIARLAAAAPHCRVHAAGGIRNAGDLAQTLSAGAAGALIATSLHDGRIGRDELQAFAAA